MRQNLQLVSSHLPCDASKTELASQMECNVRDIESSPSSSSSERSEAVERGFGYRSTQASGASSFGFVEGRDTTVPLFCCKITMVCLKGADGSHRRTNAVVQKA